MAGSPVVAGARVKLLGTLSADLVVVETDYVARLASQRATMAYKTPGAVEAAVRQALMVETAAQV